VLPDGDFLLNCVLYFPFLNIAPKSASFKEKREKSVSFPEKCTNQKIFFKKIFSPGA